MTEQGSTPHHSGVEGEDRSPPLGPSIARLLARFPELRHEHPELQVGLRGWWCSCRSVVELAYPAGLPALGGLAAPQQPAPNRCHLVMQ